MNDTARNAKYVIDIGPMSGDGTLQDVEEGEMDTMERTGPAARSCTLELRMPS